MPHQAIKHVFNNINCFPIEMQIKELYWVLCTVEHIKHLGVGGSSSYYLFVLADERTEFIKFIHMVGKQQIQGPNQDF